MRASSFVRQRRELPGGPITVRDRSGGAGAEGRKSAGESVGRGRNGDHAPGRLRCASSTLGRTSESACHTWVAVLLLVVNIFESSSTT